MIVSGGDDIEAVGREMFKKEGAVSGASYLRKQER